MIGIVHPKVCTKPPIDKASSLKVKAMTRQAEEFADLNLMRTESSQPFEKTNFSTNNNNNNNMQTEGCMKETDMSELKSDDKNTMESTCGSFKQLCNIINELEQDTSNNIEYDQPVGHLKHNDEMILNKNYINQLKPEKDCNIGNRGTNKSTYDDIMSFLGTLETEFLNETRTDDCKLDTLSNIQEILNNNQCFTNCNSCTFKEDLAVSRLEIEEKDAIITLLKNQLKTERISACEKLDSQKKQYTTKIQTEENKYKDIVKRHQKFIEQLISEKRDMTEKCTSLTQKIKEIEAKTQRDLKTIADRHAVEMQRMREHYMASEKIRRERWLEARTSKIKEMTVKGLEPELRSMTEQHQQEIQELRSAHMKELQDVELRGIRRSNHQLEQLRLELTASHEKMLADEKNILSIRYKEILEEQEGRFRVRCKKLMEDLEQEKTMLRQQQLKRDAENNAILQQKESQFQKEIEMLKQQHQLEKRKLQDSLQEEWSKWLMNYEKRQIIVAEEKEKRMKEKCLRERDKQIEIAIERLGRESQEMKTTMQESYDDKLRSLTEKYEAELKVAVNNETAYKSNLFATQEKLEKTKSQYDETKNKLQECRTNMETKDELIRNLTTERDNAKKIARQEIESEKRGLEDKIASLYQEITQINTNREALLAQLHSRVKLIMNQKILTIRNLTRELGDVKLKCEHLEKLLDQQRKEYILKSL